MWRKSSRSVGNGACVEIDEWRKSSHSESGNCVEVNEWRTSSYTYGNGNCVEINEWRKSSHSMNQGNCVEVGNGIQVRDSKDPDGTVLRFEGNAWEAFLEGLK